jgi:pSer/pThr/pTyr-binding forkhead associated (FHA) protein
VNPVARFESFIERLMERTFARATGSRLQPVEVGKRLIRAMEAEQSVGVAGVLVPNVYDVYLSELDFEHFEPMQRSFIGELEIAVARAARRRQYHMVSRPLVRLHRDRALSDGDVRVAAHLQDVEEPDLVASQHTGIMPQIDDLVQPVVPAGPSLLLNGRSFAILRSPTRLGRLPDNDIVVDDRRVSRKHAEVLQQAGRWMIVDRGSSNGTWVNGRRVQEAALHSGDTISLGGIEATWEQ